MPIANLETVDIYHSYAGNGKIPLVFCHGLGGDSSNFEKEDAKWYSEHFDLVCWDNRGLGRSGNSKNYSLPLYAEDLWKLLDYLAIEAAVIFGVSWGGVLAQRFALDYPEKCLALILDSTSSEVNKEASEGWYSQGEHAKSENPLNGRKLKECQIESFIAQCRATAGLREHPLTPQIAEIQAPTLIVAGGSDKVAGAGGSVILSRNIPNSKLHIFQGAGHGTYALERDNFRKLLLDFMRQIDLKKNSKFRSTGSNTVGLF